MPTGDPIPASNKLREFKTERDQLIAECETAYELLSLIIENFGTEEWGMPKHKCEVLDHPEACWIHETITIAYHKLKILREERLRRKMNDLENKPSED